MSDGMWQDGGWVEATESKRLKGVFNRVCEDAEFTPYGENMMATTITIRPDDYQDFVGGLQKFKQGALGVVNTAELTPDAGTNDYTLALHKDLLDFIVGSGYLKHLQNEPRAAMRFAVR